MSAGPDSIAEMTVPAASAPQSYVDWGAILVGAFIAAAISFVMITFGAAIGLSMTALNTASTATATAMLLAGGLWLLWAQVSGFVDGAYMAGRLQRRVPDATEHESEMRDGGHGLAVWAVGLAAGLVLASGIAVLGTVGVAQTMPDADPAAYYTDRLLRSNGDTAGAAPAAQSEFDNTEFSRVLARGVLRGTQLDEADNAFLVNRIEARTGLPEAEAQAKLDQTLGEMKAQADRARRYGILAAFLAAASLMISAAAAWWGAVKGGEHRDSGVDLSHYARWR